MALRAGYYGVKRFLRNKLETIAGTYDETIKSLFPRSEQAVLSAKNLNYHNATTSASGGVTYTVNADLTVTLSNTSTSSTIKDLRTYTGTELKALGKDLILNGGNAKVYLAIRDASYNFIARSYGEDAPFDTSTLVDATTYYETIGITSSGVDTTGVVIKPMIRLGSDPDPTFAPYAMTNRELTNSASDQKTVINAIITAATGAADFAAFKTAMGAITPVTRSLSLTKEDKTEEVKEDIEPEKTVTKKRTTKKTEEV